jgi:hypothetical protein
VINIRRSGGADVDEKGREKTREEWVLRGIIKWRRKMGEIR